MLCDIHKPGRQNHIWMNTISLSLRFICSQVHFYQKIKCSQTHAPQAAPEVQSAQETCMAWRCVKLATFNFSDFMGLTSCTEAKQLQLQVTTHA